MKRKFWFVFSLISLCYLCCNPSICTAHLTKLTLALDWFPNPDHGPIIVAIEKGYFKEVGLAVDLIAPSDPSEPPKWVAAKKVDLAITYEPEFMQQVDQGLPLIRIGTLIDKPLDCIVVLKKNNITRIADLKGKKIGSGSNGANAMMLKVMLEQNGLTAADVEIINVRYNLTQALLSGKVDAVTGMMRNFEIPQLELAGFQVRAFFPEAHHIPNYSVLIIVAHSQNTNDPRLRLFLKAIRKAAAYIQNQPQESWNLFAKRYPESNNQVNRKAWFATMQYFAEDPAAFNRKEWQRFAEFMFKNQMIRQIQDVKRYAIVLR